MLCPIHTGLSWSNLEQGCVEWTPYCIVLRYIAVVATGLTW